MVLWIFIQSILNGLMAGGVYALMAVGITIIFGVMRLVNFATGAFFVISMYIGYLGYSIFGGNCYTLIPFVSIILAIVGYFSFRLSISPVLNKSRDATILVTIGLSVLLPNLAIMIFGGAGLSIPSEISSKSLVLGEYTISYPRFIAFVAALLMVIIMWFIINRTNFGRAMRATSESVEVAQMLGINTKKVFTIAWILGVVTTGIAGVMLTPIYMITYNVGASFRTTALLAVVLGGLGDIRGAFVCGILLGIVEAMVASVVSADIGALGVFLVYLVIFLFKPQGIFGRKERVG